VFHEISDDEIIISYKQSSNCHDLPDKDELAAIKKISLWLPPNMRVVFCLGHSAINSLKGESKTGLAFARPVLCESYFTF
jgi:hypothetical protein